MTNITIALPDEQASLLKQQSQQAGVSPEDLLRERVEIWLTQPPKQDDFAAAAAYVLEKNAELYRRLS